MKQILKITILMMVFMVPINIFCHGNDNWPVLKGPYLGQKQPGMVPKIFAPGIVSTGFHEHSGLVFSKELDECFFSIAWYEPTVIINIRKCKNGWTKPFVAAFSGNYADDDPIYGPKGKQLYFCSKRPIKKNQIEPEKKYNIWFVEKDETGKWKKPVYHPKLSHFNGRRGSFASNGNYYFCIPKGKHGGWDIYRSRFKNGRYQKPESLGETINSKYHEFPGQIANDESFLIFTSNRPENKTGMYISFLNKKGYWSVPKFFNSSINQGYVERFSTISPDGKYIFFNRQMNKFPEFYINKKITLKDLRDKHNASQNGFGDIYWVDAKIIEELQQNYLKRGGK
jgi:hypothetical protein